jgi:hypothetical protein
MRLPIALAFAASLLLAAEARAACTCECIEGQERALCTSLRDEIPVCGRKACPAPPWSAKPSDSKLPPPPGTYGCEPMRVYDRLSNHHSWSELCTGSARGGVAFVRRPIALPVPAIPMPSASSGRARRAAPAYGGGGGVACNTDADCPGGSTCTRPTMNDPWTCHAR